MKIVIDYTWYILVETMHPSSQSDQRNAIGPEKNPVHLLFEQPAFEKIGLDSYEYIWFRVVQITHSSRIKKPMWMLFENENLKD